MEGGFYGWSPSASGSPRPVDQSNWGAPQGAQAWRQGFYGRGRDVLLRDGKGNAWGGGALVGSLAAQSWRGGGAVGALDAKSWQGGGSVASIPIKYEPDGRNLGPGPNSCLHFFLKAGAAPVSDTTVFDLNFGAPGYWRLRLTTGLNLLYEANFLGSLLSYDINAGTPLVAGSWYWVACGFGSAASDNSSFGLFPKLQAQVWSTGGATVGMQASAAFAQRTPNAQVTANAALGLGVTITSAYANWPNSTGWEMSKGILINNMANWASGSGWAPLNPPTGDTAAAYPASYTAYWNARQTLGAAATLIDVTTNANSAAAGAAGLTIVSDGPYA